ncbi:hypothetical protein ECFRIK1997_1545, partial [Escherichia coli FRIK1997]
MSLPCQ